MGSSLYFFPESAAVSRKSFPLNNFFMDKLNEYLQSLLSTCSYELHLEPNKQPYLISGKGTTELSNSPIFGTQISMMIFPLIPADVKQQLPNQAEVEFVHPHNLGNFSFTVRKSPSGFNVTIRPMLSEPAHEPQTTANFSAPQPPQTFSQTNFESNSNVFSPPSPPVAAKSDPNAYKFESVSAASEENFNFTAESSVLPQLEIESHVQSATVFPPNAAPMQIEVTSVNDPEFITTFSAESTYEPPGRRDDFTPASSGFQPPANNFAPPANEYNFSNDVQPVQAAAPPQYAPQPNFPQETYMSQTQFVQPPAQQMPVMPPQAPAAVASEFVPARQNPQAKARMDALFHKMSEVGASDLHMSVSMPPMVRKDGKMQILQCNETKLTADSIRELLTSIMPAKNQEEFAQRNDSDFAYEIPNLARFRANIFMDRKGMGGVFRIIPTKILTAEQLGLSQAIMNLCELSKGLVVVTGPTGSGKSTTLCAMIDHINKKREDHIITIEDPIEFTHENQKCLVNQREVHNHTDSFKDALRAALREDPDILLVGEMRDLETISIAIETAETGHLVFGTLHTTTAASTVDRIIDQFPADRQQQIRVMLSESLKGVIAQTLLPKKGGGRVAALEVLIVTPAISNLIREGKTFQINSAMQTGKQHGMVMLNDALFALVQKGLVEPRDAYIKAVDKANLETMLTRGGFRI
jgi:twitching motility protein PilT